MVRAGGSSGCPPAGARREPSPARHEQVGMQWTDDGVVLGARKHGESSLILELMTRAHGRHLGLVHGGRSKTLQPVLQTGNTVQATWRARLAEHPRTLPVE